MFYIYVLILIYVTSAIGIYHYRRKKIIRETSGQAFYWMFLFVALWITFRAIYLLDYQANWGWSELGWFGSIPVFFTFVCFSVAIDSM